MARIVLTASDGMVYTDGIGGGKVIYLAESQSAEEWYEVPEETFIRALESGASIGDATEEDYQAALREFGVKL